MYPCLVVADPFDIKQETRVITPRDSDLVDLHTLVAEHGDASHGAVKSYSLMGVVGREQARRGQPVAEPATQPLPDLDREKDREMLAQVKTFVGDDDKLLVEYQQDIDIDIGIESELPKLEFDREFDQEFKDCVEVPRRVSRRVLRPESLRESLRAWLRVQVCLRESLRRSFRAWLRVCIQVCLHAERESAVSELWEIS